MKCISNNEIYSTSTWKCINNNFFHSLFTIRITVFHFRPKFNSFLSIFIKVELYFILYISMYNIYFSFIFFIYQLMIILSIIIKTGAVLFKYSPITIKIIKQFWNVSKVKFKNIKKAFKSGEIKFGF